LYYNNGFSQGFFVVQKRFLGEKIMQEWEYKVIRGYSSEKELNKLGAEGWELVAVVAGGAEETSQYKDNITGWGAQDVYVYLKRLKS
jgi:hypothetical protein